MEEGSLRCDANISIRPGGTTGLGTKTELKNMNSFHGVEKALEYEIARQKDAVGNNEKIIQQSLLWDSKNMIATPMRSKENAHDYRYFPEPDLIPLAISEEWKKDIKESLPELPAQKQNRFETQYHLRPYDCMVLCDNRALADFFENTVSLFPDGITVSKWIQTEILRIAKDKKCKLQDLKITPEKLSSLLKLVKDGVINANAAKDILSEMEATDKAPHIIIKEKGLAQISDEDTIAEKIQVILAKNPEEVKAYKAGKEKLWGFFIGQVMKETKGKGNPALINKILKEKFGQ
jgi:aspartyl-tRNA(Asn)/glutamyl-tRNA(Gln) amidotransferase subunit B